MTNGDELAPPEVTLEEAPAVDIPTLILRSLDNILQQLQAGVYARPGGNWLLQQYTLTDTSKFSKLLTIPDTALSWELWNSDLGPTGVLLWAYTPQPGTVGNAAANRLAVGTRASRSLYGVDLYLQPATVGQIVVIEVVMQ